MAKEKRTEKTILTGVHRWNFKEVTSTPSPVGFESSGQNYGSIMPKPLPIRTVDPYGTAVAVVNPTSAFKVVIEAHADEISWFVNYITDQGRLPETQWRR